MVVGLVGLKEEKIISAKRIIVMESLLKVDETLDCLMKDWNVGLEFRLVSVSWFMDSHKGGCEHDCVQSLKC